MSSVSYPHRSLAPDVGLELSSDVLDTDLFIPLRAPPVRGLAFRIGGARHAHPHRGIFTTNNH